MTDPGRIECDMFEGIMRLRLVNPQRRNAISANMWRALQSFATEVRERGDVRGVLVRGDGDRVFSGGADLSEFGSMRSGAQNAPTYDDLVEETCQLIEAIPQPTIAMINGPCIGAGASLAASCDLRLAAEDAFFAIPAAKLGLGYDIRGIARFLRTFGSGATRQLIFTAQQLSARRAFTLGSVHEIHPPRELEMAAISLAKTIAENAPLTIAAAKLAIRALTTDPELAGEAQALAERADASADYIEGRAAFEERRSPSFRGN